MKWLLLLFVPALLLAQVDAPTMQVSLEVDVRNGDQQGKLMIGPDVLAFESLTDGKHSRSWKYAEIRSLEKKKKELRVKPYKGDRYDFQVKENSVRDRLYDIIAKRVIDARAAERK
jgi:hypothetical protein